MPFSEIHTIGPPQPTEIEVCVFGPSFGECIIVHLGNGHWVVFDSCMNHDGSEPVALSYLNALGLAPASAIKVIVATHWHNDHCKGLARIVGAAPAAYVWISSALTTPEFFRFAKRMGKNKTTVAGTKLSEFESVIDEIAARNKAGLLTFGYASSRMPMVKIDAKLSGHGWPCEVTGLSPSPGDTLNFLTRIAAQMPRVRQTKHSVPSPSPNDVSVATLVTIGPLSILLGADLEKTGSQTTGWNAVIAAHHQIPFGPNNASLYKIAHHGSENAHSLELWQELLEPNPFAVLTPWRNGSGRLPTGAGITNIMTETKRALATASEARTRRPLKERPPGVLRFLRENNIRIRSLTAPFGCVRFRMPNLQSGTWNVELFGSACTLAELARTKEFH